MFFNLEFITQNSELICAQDWIRTSTVARHPLKMVRLPISPPGQLLKLKNRMR